MGMVTAADLVRGQVRPSDVDRQSDVTAVGIGFSGDGGPTDKERMYRTLLDFTMRESYAFWVIKKFINDQAKIHLYNTHNINPGMEDDEIVRHVLFNSGAWQALTMLWQKLTQESLQAGLDNALASRLDMESTHG